MTMSNRSNRRPLRSRHLRRPRGSILIMVVAVLVLLALMGTAYISVARIDRQSAVPLNSAGPQEVIDQLLPTVRQMAEKVIIEDVLTATGTFSGYRPHVPTGATNVDADPWDSVSPNWGEVVSGQLQLRRPNDAWLASRMPVLMNVSNSP